MKRPAPVLKEEYIEICLACPKFDYDFGCTKQVTDDDIRRCELELAIMRDSERINQMSNGIIVVNMPECCDICRFSSLAYGMEQFKEGECFCLIKMKSVDRILEGEKPDWCPIRPMPEKAFHEDFCDNGRYDKGWNDCLREIGGIKDDLE